MKSNDIGNQAFEDALKAFAEEHSKQIAILHGGDGTLVNRWREFAKGKNAKMLFPIRNYGLCKEHFKMLMDFFSGSEDAPSVKQFMFPILQSEFDLGDGTIKKLDALAEFTVVGVDPTSALRFNVEVNGKHVVEDAIANGAIVATALGSTGYFKSVSRTIFTDGLGVGFIAPTYSIPNIVANSEVDIAIELRRKANIFVTADKLTCKIDAKNGWRINIKYSPDNISVLGYDIFMCPKCRANRNSTIVNDNYNVV